MIAMVSISLTHNIHGIKLLHTDDFTLTEGDKVKLKQSGMIYYGVFLGYDYEGVCEGEFIFDSVEFMEDYEIKKYHQQMEANLIHNNLRVSNAAYRVYKNHVKDTRRLKYNDVRAKLTRNVLLSIERRQFYNHYSGEFLFMYGSMFLNVKDGVITRIQNVRGMNINFTKDKLKYDELSVKMNIKTLV